MKNVWETRKTITMAAPLISIEKICDSDPIPIPDGGKLPLRGIRILDNTQIYAGLGHHP